ncbi:EamA family transporter [Candidatus Bipolaricaulota bacterium]|nr:EamA family transporter [Candidatus Bipolaricaulota bacterium]
MKRTTFVWLLLGVIWGSTWLFIKLGLEDLPPFSLAGLRFFLAAAIMWGYLVIRRIRLPRSRGDWMLLTATGLLTFGLDYGLIFWGENHISAGLTSILFSTMPLFVLVLAHFMVPAERMTRRKLAGILVGIGGVSLIFSRQLAVTDSLAMWGAVAILAGAAFAAVSSVLVRRYGGHIAPAVLTTVQMTVGCLPLLLIGFTLEGSPTSFHWTPIAWTSLLYMAVIGSAVAFVLLYWLLKRIGAVRSVLIIPFSTVVAVILGIVVLGEAFTWRTGVGGLLVILGLLAASRPGAKTREVNENA